MSGGEKGEGITMCHVWQSSMYYLLGLKKKKKLTENGTRIGRGERGGHNNVLWMARGNQGSGGRSS